MFNKIKDMFSVEKTFDIPSITNFAHVMEHHELFLDFVEAFGTEKQKMALLEMTEKMEKAERAFKEYEIYYKESVEAPDKITDIKNTLTKGVDSIQLTEILIEFNLAIMRSHIIIRRLIDPESPENLTRFLLKSVDGMKNCIKSYCELMEYIKKTAPRDRQE